MPLSGSGTVLGVAFAAAGLIVDPLGLAASGDFANALTSWLVSNIVVSNITLDAPLTAAGSAVTGKGILEFSAPGADLGDALADAVSFPIVGNRDKWHALGNAIVDHIHTNGAVNPALFVASPSGGPVTGQGLLTFATTSFSPPLAEVLDAPGPINSAVWAAVGAAILGHISANAVVNTLGFTSPSGGGPLVGFSTIG